MIRVSLILFVILLVMFLSPFTAGQKGYVLIAMGQYTIEMTVISMAISLAVGLLLLWLAEWLLKRLFRFSSSGKNWFSSRTQRKAKQDFHDGLLALHEQDWQQAEKLLTRSAEKSENPALNYLYAGEAAQRLNQPEQVANYLANASEFPDAQLVSKIKLFENQLAQQVDILTELNQMLLQHPKHAKLLILKSQSLQQQGKWLELLEFLEQAKPAMEKSQFNQLQLDCYACCFDHIAEHQGLTELESFWQTLPRKYKNQQQLKLSYIQALITQQAYGIAEQQLLPLLKKKPQAQILELLKNLKPSNPLDIISLLEKQLKQTPEDINLLRALGHISRNSKDVALAQKAFQKVCQLTPNKQDWIALAEVAEDLGNSELALNCYKNVAVN